MKTVRISVLALSLLGSLTHAADIDFVGVSGGHWVTASNWENNSYPTSSDIAFLDKTASLDTPSPNDLNAIRVGTLGDGILHITFNGSLSANAVNSSSRVGSGTGNYGAIEQTNGSLTVNELEIGGNDSTGIYNLNRGTLTVSRRLQDNSLYLGTDASKTSTGHGTLSITAGSITTRGEAYLGSASGGIGIFEVQGSDSAQIGIGSNGTLDGAWTQNAGSVLRIRIDRSPEGVTPIFIDDADNDGSGGDVLFEDGALLDVDFLANFVNGGTYTVMEWEGNLTDNGLQFAPSVDTNIWSFDLDTVNKQLTVTAVGDAYTREFVHPGSRHKLSDLQRMRDMVAAGVEPWASAFANLEASNQSRLEFTPANAETPLTTLTSTSVLRVEAMIAYHNSLMWNITGDQRYADVAVDILNSYSYITNISGLTPLSIGQSCCHLVEAAEIIKHTYDGWETADMQRFSDMLVYPGYSNTTEPTGDASFYWKLLNGDPARAGNQGLFSMRSMLAMGVFLDNERIYDRALRYMRGATNRADDLAYPTGPPINGDATATHDYAIQWGQSSRETTIADYGYNEVIANYIWESGQNEESSRDQAHGAVGLININVACEQAWNQGEDLYGHLDNRLLLGWEFLNRYNLSYLTSFPDQTTTWEPTIESGEYLQRLARTGRRFSLKVNPHIDGNTEAWTRGGPSTYPNFEIIMAHYRDRMGLTGDAIKWSERGHNYFQDTYGVEVLGPASTYSTTNWGGLKYRRVSPGDPVEGFINGKPVFAMHALPGTIEAENFDYFPLDGEGRSYHDLSIGNSGQSYRLAEGVDLSPASEGGYAISSIEAGEWVTYTISVPETRNYDIGIRYASMAAGGTIQFSFDGVDRTGEVAIPYGSPDSTGDSDWQTLVIANDVPLTQGVQQLKIHFGGVSNSYLISSLSILRDFNTLIGHWAFDDAPGATTITDASGNGYHGTNAGATSTIGTDGSALDFNGTDAEVSLPASVFENISDAITISMWVYGDDALPLESSVFTAQSGNLRELNIHLPWSNGNVYWDAGNDSGVDRINKLADASQYKNAWNHWAFTKNATTGSMKIYHNGALWHSATDKTKTIEGVTSVSIGSDDSESFYNGVIDDLRLYNIDLTDQEIAGLYYQYPPFAVSGLAANATSSSQISLDWNAAPGASSYNLKRSLSSGGPYTTIASDLSSLNYIDTGLSTGTTYYYVVSAVYNGIIGAASSEANAVTNPPTGSAPVITTTSLPAGTIGSLYQQTLSATGGDAPLTWSLSSGALPSGLTFGNDGVLRGTATQSGTYNFTVKLVDTHEDVDTQALSLVMYPLGGGPAEKFLLESGDITVSEYQDPNLPAYTIDEDLNTRWSANGDGQWIRYDLGAVRNVQHLEIAWLSGDSRVAYFDIEVSEDDSTWTPLVTGLQSSGTTVDLQTAEITDTLTRYIRIVGYGNSGSSWNSITEVEIWGNTPVPPLTPTNLAATPGNGEIAINWMVSESATLHHLKRSTTEGSGYTTIASEAGASFLDTNVVNGTIYFYIISAENDAGESANSNPISAKPYAPITDDELAPVTMTRNGNSMDMHLDSIQGRIYQLQKSDQLNPVDWQDLGAPVIGDGNSVTLEDPDASNFTERFYRIEIQP